MNVSLSKLHALRQKKATRLSSLAGINDSLIDNQSTSAIEPP